MCNCHSLVQQAMPLTMLISSCFFIVGVRSIPTTMDEITETGVPSCANLSTDSPIPYKEYEIRDETNVQCGQQLTYYIGGGSEPKNNWPWLAAIFWTRGGHQFHLKSVYCAGALISRKFVMTAAHCTSKIKPEELLVRLGEHQLNQATHHEIDMMVTRIIEHDSYVPGKLRNDIALLQLADSVRYSMYISPICLPPGGLPEDVFVGCEASVAGWGKMSTYEAPSNVLQSITVEVATNAQCHKAYWPVSIEPSHLCAGSRHDLKDACQGDSGGPLILEHDKVSVAIGLVSFGQGCGELNQYGVYTRTSAFIDWIRQHVPDAQLHYMRPQ